MLMFTLLYGLTGIIMYKMNIIYSIRPETINSPSKHLLKPEIKWAMGSFFHTLLYNQYHLCWPLERIQPSLFCSFLWVAIVIFILPQLIKCSVKQILKVQWGPCTGNPFTKKNIRVWAMSCKIIGVDKPPVERRRGEKSEGGLTVTQGQQVQGLDIFLFQSKSSNHNKLAVITNQTEFL